MVKRIKLTQGLELAFKKFKDRKSASIGVWIRRGARCEPARVKGIAHFLEHLLFKGSRNYSYKKIKQQIEGRGGQLNGFTSQEFTCYYTKTLDTNAQASLDVLSDMVALPLLKQKDIQKERGVILEEIRMYNDMPSSRVSSILDGLLWSKSALGIDVIGKLKTIKRISQKDLKAFKQRFYKPSNIVVVYCGKEIPASFYAILKKFSTSGTSKSLKLDRAKVNKRFNFKQEVTSFEQTHLSLGFSGFNYFDKRRFILDLIHVILGANMSSRLFEAIREKRGLAYEVSTGVKKYKDTGAFIVHCGLEAKNVNLAVRVILKELGRLKRKQVATLELSRAKDYLLGNFAMGLESTLNSMFYIGESICSTNRVLSFGEVEKEILSITTQDVRTIAQKIFTPNKMKVAIVTNRKESYLPDLKKII